MQGRALAVAPKGQAQGRAPMIAKGE